MIINEGKKEILEKYLNAYDLYLGLWTSTGLITSNTFTSDSFKFYELKDLKEYARVLIPRGSWTLGEDLTYTSPDISFTPLYQNWSDIYGYFITSSEDNSGILVSITQYDLPESLIKAVDSLIITPKIKMV